MTRSESASARCEPIVPQYEPDLSPAANDVFQDCRSWASSCLHCIGLLILSLQAAVATMRVPPFLRDDRAGTQRRRLSESRSRRRAYVASDCIEGLNCVADICVPAQSTQHPRRSSKTALMQTAARQATNSDEQGVVLGCKYAWGTVRESQHQTGEQPTMMSKRCRKNTSANLSLSLLLT